MSKSLKRSPLPWVALLICTGGLAATGSCGGEGPKRFGGNDTGGAPGATGGDVGSGSGGSVNPGSGGATATGGTPGNGGDTATGGTPGTGGRASGGAPGTGGAGATATGGRPVTGGVSGTGATGATTGTGGSGGTGATTGTGGSGGRPGTGGTPGTGGSTAMCDAIATDYQNEMPNARMCNTLTGLTVPQCQMMAASGLGCGSNCIVYVQDNAKLTELQKRWTAMGCQSIIRTCPAIACIDAKPGYCYASTGSIAAQCQSGPKN